MDWVSDQPTTDLDAIIYMAERAFESSSVSGKSQAEILNKLGLSLYKKFLRHKSTTYLDKAITIQRQTIEKTRSDHPERAARLSQLGLFLDKKYACTKELKTIEESIITWQHAVSTMPPHHPGRGKRLKCLSNSMKEKHSHTGATSDLDQAILVALEAIDAMPLLHPSRTTYLKQLCKWLQQRYLRTAARTDFPQELFRRLIRYPDKSELLYVMGNHTMGSYSHAESTEHFEEGIQLLKAAAITTQPGHEAQLLRVTTLLVSVLHLHYATNRIEDLDEAIEIGRQAANITSLDRIYPYRAGLLTYLGLLLGQKYSHTKAIENLNEAIQFSEQGVGFMPLDHPYRAELLHSLMVFLSMRHCHTETIEDLEEAIHHGQQTIKTMPLDCPHREFFLSMLENLLGTRYSLTGSMSDLNAAVHLGQQVLDTMTQDHPERMRRLCDLGYYLNNRYLRAGATADIDKAIYFVQQAIDITPLDHPDRPEFLDNFAGQLITRYSFTGTISDLDKAIDLGREAINTTPLDHPKRMRLLYNLGYHLKKRYSHTNAIEDLNECVHLAQEAFDITPEDHPQRLVFMSNFARFLSSRYFHTGATKDIEYAIHLVRQEFNTIPLDDLGRAKLSDSLGLLLCDRYSFTGAREDLEEAINLEQYAVDNTPLDHPEQAQRLADLARLLTWRHNHTGVVADIHKALSLSQQAIIITPPNHPNKSIFLGNYASCLAESHSRTKAISDLNEAIQIEQHVVKIMPLHDEGRIDHLRILSNYLARRFACTKDIADIDEAILLAQHVVDATPLDHRARAGALSGLGSYLSQRFSHTRAIEDLNEGLRIEQQALSITPPGHQDRARQSFNLAKSLYWRYLSTKAIADLEQAKAFLLESLNSSTFAISNRIASGRLFLSLQDIIDDLKVYSAAKSTVDLIPLLIPGLSQNTDKRHLLASAVGISSDAAAIALHTCQPTLAAIECLETGRGVIGGALLQQHDISALEKARPDLARCFITLHGQVDSPSSLHPGFSINTSNVARLGQAQDQRGKANQQLESLLDTIRSTPGFERFLLPISEAEMRDAAKYGPIVCVNVSKHRCDALVIKESGLHSLRLPHVSQKLIENYSQDPGSIKTLGWLWDTIVYPILDDLNFTRASPKNQLPRMWWIPTGKLTKFPLHAAGHYAGGSGDSALDMVVSSYASSVKTIIHSRRNLYQRPEDLHIIAVAMKNTDGQRPLAYAKREAEEVLAVLGSAVSRQVRPRECKKDVLEAIETCSIFHFAGHGSTDPMEPLQSSLLLNDWKEEPLTVESLLDTKLTKTAPFLAYLSACGTSQIENDGAVDENIHMANAFQLAGFRHVIGTLWSVDDGLCVEMAALTYEYLRDNGMDDESASRGLHHATVTLRDRWLDIIGEVERSEGRDMREKRAAQLEDDVEWKRPLWAPYVHLGV